MLERDRVFLNDYVQFNWMNHIAVAVALYEAGFRPDDTAALVRFHGEEVDLEKARVMALSLNDGVRMQAIVVAKLFAELVSAMEDFGALCFAIRHRSQGGILRQYLEYSISDVVQLFKDVKDCAYLTVDCLLNLPTLELIEQRVPPNLHQHYQASYSGCWSTISKVAASYKAPPEIRIDNLAAQTELSQGWGDAIAVLLTTADPSERPSGDPRGLYPRVYNKIKHGFVVLESVHDYARLTSTGQRFEVAYHNKGPNSVANLLQGVVAIAKMTAEVAALVLTLDEDKLL